MGLFFMEFDVFFYFVVVIEIFIVMYFYVKFVNFVFLEYFNINLVIEKSNVIIVWCKLFMVKLYV